MNKIMQINYKEKNPRIKHTFFSPKDYVKKK